MMFAIDERHLKVVGHEGKEQKVAALLMIPFSFWTRTEP